MYKNVHNLHNTVFLIFLENLISVTVNSPYTLLHVQLISPPLHISENIYAHPTEVHNVKILRSIKNSKGVVGFKGKIF